MTQPWKHQEEAIQCAMPHTGFMFAHDMGCIDGDAVIDGTGITLKQLYIEEHCFLRATSLCGDCLGPNKIKKVLYKGFRQTARIKTKLGKELILTPDHEIATVDWSWLSPVSVNNSILTVVDHHIAIDSITSLEDSGIREVYDIVMEDPYRNFVANGVIVHNCGKTYEAIELANRKKARKILIQCPVSVMDVWPEQFWKHSKVKWNCLVLDKGTVKKKAQVLKHALDLQTVTKHRLAVIVNYESAWRPGLGPDYNKKNRILNKGVILSTVWDMVIADESHRLKSPKSKTSWFNYQIAKLGKVKFRLCLTGTPMPHGPLDVYAQFRFMDFSVYNKNFAQFRNRYAVIKDMGDFKKVVGYQREEELNAIFYTRAHRVKKGDVLDLPPVMHEIRTCKLSKEAQKIYNSVKIEFVAWLDEIGDKITAANVLTKLLRLGQITGGFVKLDSGESKIVCNAKLDILADIFEDLAPDEPIVIFARFTNEIQRIKKLAEKMGRPAAELSGQMKQLKEWKDGRFNIIAIQISSGGVGIDLTRARYCVYFSTGYSLGDYEQSLARVDRPGQTYHVTYYHLLAENTVDIDIYNSLSKKKAIVEYVLKQMRTYRG